MPQRRAHHLVGAIVGEAMQRKLPLRELPLVFDAGTCIGKSMNRFFECLGSKNAVDAFVSYGSTSPEQVRGQIDRWKEVLGDASA